MEHNTALFNQIFSTYYQQLVCVAAGLVDRQVAEEVVDDVFVKVHQRRLYLESTNIKALLFISVCNAARNKYATVRHVMQDIDCSHIADEQKDDQEYHAALIAEVLHLINELPDRQRIALMLRLNGIGRQDIAKRMGVTVDTVRNHIRNGLVAVRKRFSNSSHRVRFND
ncbi:MAG TPA: sigma-70 family RNA polymerase sigma factor [Chitinophagaceae bacterium]|nr:sigma-70 family RNA polymerase sigma factor [Chitinophagaceae bacterium]